jgi:hypothetical protein
MTDRYPWDLSRVPNYTTAPSVAVVDAADLDAHTFRRRYVLRNVPCLVKGAVVRWLAFQAWRDTDYILAKIGDLEVRASCRPKIEGFGLRSPSRDAAARQMTRDELLAPETVRRLLPRLRTPGSDVLFIELRPADKGVAALGDDLLADGQRFSFYRNPPRPRFLYSGWAVMFYKNSYSDWHFHPGTDAVMCQVAGTKDVLLLPPTQLAWDQLVPIHTAHWKVYDVDLAESPAYLDIKPLRAVVEPGDGLFIPVNWWHAVQARPREHGVTVPITWESPYRDLRQPATRHFLRALWQREKRLAAGALVASACSTLANTFRQGSTITQPRTSTCV